MNLPTEEENALLIDRVNRTSDFYYDPRSHDGRPQSVSHLCIQNQPNMSVSHFSIGISCVCNSAKALEKSSNGVLSPGVWQLELRKHRVREFGQLEWGIPEPVPTQTFVLVGFRMRKLRLFLTVRGHFR